MRLIVLVIALDCDELTLRAISDSFGAHVHVVTSHERNWYLKYLPDTPKTSKHVFLACEGLGTSEPSDDI